MKVRWQAMGTSEGSWLDNLEWLREYGKEDEVSLVEISLENGVTVTLEEVLDELTKDTVVSHLTIHIQPIDTAPLDIHCMPSTSTLRGGTMNYYMIIDGGISRIVEAARTLEALRAYDQRACGVQNLWHVREGTADLHLIGYEFYRTGRMTGRRVDIVDLGPIFFHNPGICSTREERIDRQEES